MRREPSGTAWRCRHVKNIPRPGPDKSRRSPQILVRNSRWHPRRSRACPGRPAPDEVASAGKDVPVSAPYPSDFRSRDKLTPSGDKPIGALEKDPRMGETCLQNWMTPGAVDDKGSVTTGAGVKRRSCAGPKGPQSRTDSTRFDRQTRHSLRQEFDADVEASHQPTYQGRTATLRVTNGITSRVRRRLVLVARLTRQAICLHVWVSASAQRRWHPSRYRPCAHRPTVPSELPWLPCSY